MEGVLRVWRLFELVLWSACHLLGVNYMFQACSNSCMVSSSAWRVSLLHEEPIVR